MKFKMYKKLYSKAVHELLRYKTFLRSSSSKKRSRTSFSFFCPDVEYTNLPEKSTESVNSKTLGENVKLILELQEELKKETNEAKKEELAERLLCQANAIPNLPHPCLKNYGDNPKVIKVVKNKEPNIKVKEFSNFVKDLRVIRNHGTGHLTGSRSYYFIGEFADLEHALVKYTLSRLKSLNFKLISVPDILPSQIIERCGMVTKGERSQVYFLDKSHSENLCLSGTSEMALGGLLHNKVYNISELPLLLTAVSRCYRAETSSISEEKGIYRVHQFTKVEMFGVSTPEHSDQLLQHFLTIQEETFNALGLSFQVLDMPLHELGAPASRKFDIEAWFPGKKSYGEISSCSNCTDYQSRRLGIRYKNEKGVVQYAHTINGTACAIPRLILSLTETHQQPNGGITIPAALQPFLGGKTEIKKQKQVPKLKIQKQQKGS